MRLNQEVELFHLITLKEEFCSAKWSRVGRGDQAESS
jgi:hypothetical protein